MANKTYTLPQAPAGFGASMFMNDAAISSGMAHLVGELEKLDPTLREPLTNFTYPRDIVVESGGGWAEYISAVNVQYGVTGGSGDEAFGGGAANAIRTIQADVGKDLYKAHPYEVAMQIKFIDMQRGQMIGRSLETIYDTGIRLDFDKHMDLNVYQGFSRYGTTGLINNASVTAASVAAGGGTGSPKAWKSKTPDEILKDVNDAIATVWAAAEYDQSAIPNHILIDPANYAYLVGQKVSNDASKSILTYLLENNLAKQKGVELVIAECRYCAGAGTGSTNRMVVYCNDKRFLGMDLMVPLSRVMTQPNVSTASYDSLYVANVGEVKFHYLQPIRYFDGI